MATLALVPRRQCKFWTTCRWVFWKDLYRLSVIARIFLCVANISQLFCTPSVSRSGTASVQHQAVIQCEVRHRESFRQSNILVAPEYVLSSKLRPHHNIRATYQSSWSEILSQRIEWIRGPSCFDCWCWTGRLSALHGYRNNRLDYSNKRCLPNVASCI